MGEDQGFLLVAWHSSDMACHRKEAGEPWHEVAAVVWRWQIL